MDKKYKYKLIFGDGTVWRTYKTDVGDSDYERAFVIINLDTNKYLKNRSGRLDAKPPQSNRLVDHEGQSI